MEKMAKWVDEEQWNQLPPGKQIKQIKHKIWKLRNWSKKARENADWHNRQVAEWTEKAEQHDYT